MTDVDIKSALYLLKGFVLTLLLLGMILNIVILWKPEKKSPTIKHNQVQNSNVENGKHVICPVFEGRLGNKMFEFASSYGLSRATDMLVKIDETSELRSIFDFFAEVTDTESVCKRKDTTSIRSYTTWYDDKLTKLVPNSSFRLFGFLQSYKYFNNYSSEIRKQFSFKKSLKDQAVSKLYNLLQIRNITGRTEVTLVAVHIRRGDYVGNPKYRVASKEYLVKAVRSYQRQFKNTFFIVASNGIEWTKTNLPKLKNISVLEGNSPALDLAILSLCEHCIFTVGTFGWWACWLTGGKVTYFGIPISENKYQYFYYPNWTAL